MNPRHRWGLLAATLALSLGSVACDRSDTGTTGRAEKASEDDPAATPNALKRAVSEGMAIPQDKLKTDKLGVKVSGEIKIEGYTQGRIQIDVLQDKPGPQRPVTNARFEKVGPYEIYVPSGMGPLKLSAILDLKGDGPNMEDPKGGSPDGAIEPDGDPITGVDIVIDMSNIQEPPPQNQPPQPGEGEDGSLNIDDSEDSEIILKDDGN